MSIERKELVLYSISMINRAETDIDYSKNHLASAMDISTKTLDQYLKELDRAGFLSRKHSKYHRDLDYLVSLTPLGYEELKQLNDEIDRMTLTPERHNVPTCIPMKQILNRTRDPMEQIFLLSLFTKTKSFDLMMFLSALRITKSDSDLMKVFSEMGSEEGSGSGGLNIADGIFKTYYFTDFNEDKLLSAGKGKKDIDSLLILGNAYQRQGRNNDARMIFDHILSEKMRPDQNQWFLANYGISRVLRSQGKHDNSIEHLEMMMQMTDNTVFHAICKERIAMTLSEMGRNDEVDPLYKSVLHSFNSFGIPILSATALNNRGILRMRQDRTDLAENDWNRALKYARESKSEITMASVQLNLSDIELRKGNMERSMEKMKYSKRVFEGRYDLEGVACVEFNLALYYCFKGDREKVLEHFRRSEEIAYPAPSPLEKQERRNIVKEMAEKNGMEDLVLPPPPFSDECSVD